MIDNEVPDVPLPKRRGGRPKGSKNKNTPKPKYKEKYVRVETVLVNAPLIPLYWRVKKMTWLIRNIERELQNDPKYISPKEYFSLLKEQEEAYNKLEDEGLATNEQRKIRRERIKQKRMDADGSEVRSSRVGENESARVGAGVSAPNPLGR